MVQELVKEYEMSGDLQEASRCLRDLQAGLRILAAFPPHHACFPTSSCLLSHLIMPAFPLGSGRQISIAHGQVPSYAHELVKQVLVEAFQSPKNAPALLSLLASLAASSEISQVTRLCLQL